MIFEQFVYRYMTTLSMQLRDVAKAFGTVRAVDGIDLEHEAVKQIYRRREQPRELLRHLHDIERDLGRSRREEEGCRRR